MPITFAESPIPRKFTATIACFAYMHRLGTSLQDNFSSVKNGTPNESDGTSRNAKRVVIRSKKWCQAFANVGLIENEVHTFCKKL